MKTRKLHMIGNAHIDPVWLWQWQEGFHEVRASFRSALDRMKEYPDFTFVASSAAFYKWVEESDPMMFAEIQQRVKEGRWGIVGGWWVEPDCNIPAGESFVRHSLYGQRYFKEKFGITAQTGFNVDSFGHAGTLPQILKSVRTGGGKPLDNGRVKRMIDDATGRLGQSGRLVVRASGTEPVIRVMAEGDNRDLIEGIVDELVVALGEAAA